MSAREGKDQVIPHEMLRRLKELLRKIERVEASSGTERAEQPRRPRREKKDVDRWGRGAAVRFTR